MPEAAQRGPLPSAPTEPRAALRALLDEELSRPLLPATRPVVAEICRRHGSAVAAVIFYGSCLRKRSAEGVLDFYVIVDGYRAAHGSRARAAASALLPPGVFFCDVESDEGPLRAKYALLSTRDLERLVSARSWDCRVWSRFCQPLGLAYVRDRAAREVVLAALSEACLTFVARMTPLVPPARDAQPDPALLWTDGFRDTYRAELRSESEGVATVLYQSDCDRYDRVARAAWSALAREGRLARSAGERRRARLAWRVRRPVSKAFAVLGLLKTAWTVSDWVPYVLWKLERHTGERIEVSERQRRHPFLFGWPVLLSVLRRRLYR